MMRALRLVAFAIAGATACGQPIDIATAVKVETVSTGWLAAGGVGGKNKIVPAVSFKLTNVSGQALTAVQVNAVFRRVGGNDEIGADFRSVSASGRLAAGATTDTITLKAPLGYTGTDPHEALIRNSRFVDAKVDVFVKSGTAQWTRVGEYAVARQLNGN